MRVRAIQDGVYDGIYRPGPVDGIPGISGGIEGCVFDIEDKPYVAVDPETGKPVMEQVLDVHGNPIIDTVMVQAVDEHGNPVVGVDKKPIMNPIQKARMKRRMWSWFSPVWMVKVDPNTPLTDDENLKRGVHPSMKLKKNRANPATLSELQAEIGTPIVSEPVTI